MAWIACWRCRSSLSSRFPSPRSAWNRASSAARVPVTFLAPASRLVTVASREATEDDSAARPCSAVRTYGGVVANAPDKVCKLLASWTVLIWLICWPTPPKACVTS